MAYMNDPPLAGRTVRQPFLAALAPVRKITRGPKPAHALRG